MIDEEPAPLKDDCPIPIHEVCNVVQLKQLLKRGADINETNAFEETPLLSALRREADYDLIKELVVRGADVNVKDCWGVTPLYCAVARHGNDLKILKLLLDYGADIESGKRDSDRFLDHTVTHNRTCVELLIKYKFVKNFETAKLSIYDIEKKRKNYYLQYRKIVDLDIKPSCYEILKHYLDDCATEIINMRTVRLCKYLSLAEFLTRKNPLEDFPNPKTVNQIINRIFVELSSKRRSRYTIYSDLIIGKIGRKNLLKRLDDKIVFPKSYVSRFSRNKRIIWNLDLMHLVARYLSDVDLFNTLIAYTVK